MKCTATYYLGRGNSVFIVFVVFIVFFIYIPFIINWSDLDLFSILTYYL